MMPGSGALFATAGCGRTSIDRGGSFLLRCLPSASLSLLRYRNDSHESNVSAFRGGTILAAVFLRKHA